MFGVGTHSGVWSRTHTFKCVSHSWKYEEGAERLALLVRTLVTLEPTILKRVGESYLYKRDRPQFKTREMETVLLSF